MRLEINYSAITDAMQAKGAIYYAILQGNIILKRTCIKAYASKIMYAPVNSNGIRGV